MATLLSQLDTHNSDEDRLNLFMGRKMAIDDFNKQAKSFKRALNQFADLVSQQCSMFFSTLFPKRNYCPERLRFEPVPGQRSPRWRW